MLQIAKPLIVLSSLIQPMVNEPRMPNQITPVVYPIKEKSPLPEQKINDVITSEEVLMLIIEVEIIDTENDAR